MSVIEQVIWRSVEVELPDTETTVNIHSPQIDGNVYLGYHDGEKWKDVHAEPIDGVTHWAEMLKGPIP